jgi:hypothetical protein
MYTIVFRRFIVLGQTLRLIVRYGCMAKLVWNTSFYEGINNFARDLYNCVKNIFYET